MNDETDIITVGQQLDPPALPFSFQGSVILSVATAPFYIPSGAQGSAPQQPPCSLLSLFLSQK